MDVSINEHHIMLTSCFPSTGKAIVILILAASQKLSFLFIPSTVRLTFLTTVPICLILELSYRQNNNFRTIFQFVYKLCSFFYFNSEIYEILTSELKKWVSVIKFECLSFIFVYIGYINMKFLVIENNWSLLIA